MTDKTDKNKGWRIVTVEFMVYGTDKDAECTVLEAVEEYCGQSFLAEIVSIKEVK